MWKSNWRKAQSLDLTSQMWLRWSLRVTTWSHLEIIWSHSSEPPVSWSHYLESLQSLPRITRFLGSPLRATTRIHHRATWRCLRWLYVVTLVTEVTSGVTGSHLYLLLRHRARIPKAWEFVSLEKNKLAHVKEMELLSRGCCGGRKNSCSLLFKNLEL